MIKLYGFSLSNYHNKVKLILLEKGIDFEEVVVPMGGGPLAAQASPLHKVPYIETEQGFLCESQAIADYIEARWPTPALMPTDPWQAAKVRELITYMDLHVELCARQLYTQAFFGGILPEKFIERVKADLIKHLAAFKQLATFGPVCRRRHLHPGRLRRVREPAAGRPGQQAGVWRRPGGRRWHRLEGPRQAHRAAPHRTKSGRRSQGGHGPGRGGGTRPRGRHRRAQGLSSRPLLTWQPGGGCDKTSRQGSHHAVTHVDAEAV
jgi:glutathione S-transferase